ncbi:MAG: glycosyltransferase family 87 protein [Candidatus Thorarchaeota archaeon]|nr:glycosyltransferase family 87 protein [Candidatus Thorarchaeota archaeon]
MFRNSTGDIYTVAPNELPFRYLPSFAAVMAIFSFIPLLPLYLINIPFMLAINFGIVFLVFSISQQLGVTTSTKNFEKTLAILFITPPHILNLVLGQITHLAIFLVLTALYLLQTDENGSVRRFFWIGALIGIAAIIKPFFIVLYAFLIPITFTEGFSLNIPLRPIFGSALRFLITMIPNLLYFLVFPNAVDGFIQANFSGGLPYQHSTSIKQLLVDILSLGDYTFIVLMIMLVIGSFIFITSYYRFVRTPASEKNYLHHFTDVIFLFLMVYAESWFLFIAVLYAFLAPSLLQLYSTCESNESDTRRIDFLWSGSNNILAFFSIGIVLDFLVLGFDPINLIWIAILYILYQREYCMNIRNP